MTVVKGSRLEFHAASCKIKAAGCKLQAKNNLVPKFHSNKVAKYLSTKFV
jgi:hypothetical protein